MCWKYHEPTSDAEQQKDFTQVNIRSLALGACNSKDFRQCAKQLGDKQKSKKGKTEICVLLPEKGFTYGVPNRPSTPVKKVINNDYGNEAERCCVNQYANLMVGASQKTKFLPSITKAVNLNKEVTNMKIRQREVDPIESQNNLFKMHKFQNVRAKVSTNRKPRWANQPEGQGECEGQPNPEPEDKGVGAEPEAEPQET